MIFKHSRLSPLLFENTDLITVVNRFGITLGVGDYTIEELCCECGANADYLTAILNIYLGHTDTDRIDLSGFDPGLTVDYLRRTNNYYANAQLPNIERHLNSLVNRSSEDDNLGLLRKFFINAKDNLLKRIYHDEHTLFPTLLESGTAVITYDHDADFQISDQFADLANFFIRHLKGVYDNNLCRAVVSAILTLSKDLTQNNTLRRSLFSAAG